MPTLTTPMSDDFEDEPDDPAEQGKWGDRDQPVPELDPEDVPDAVRQSER